MVALLMPGESLPGSESLLTSVTFIRENILKVDRLHMQLEIRLLFHDFAAESATERPFLCRQNILI